MAINITATELKEKISEVLNLVYFKNTSAIIERHGKAIARIVPIEREEAPSKKSRKNIKETLDNLFGSIPDFPDITRERRFKRKKVSLE